MVADCRFFGHASSFYYVRRLIFGAGARAYQFKDRGARLLRCLRGLAAVYLSADLQSVKDLPSRQRLGLLMIV